MDWYLLNSAVQKSCVPSTTATHNGTAVREIVLDLSFLCFSVLYICQAGASTLLGEMTDVGNAAFLDEGYRKTST